MPFKVRLSKSVFILYTGLTASGYDLASSTADDPMMSLIDAIKYHTWASAAVSYFREARLEGGGVNPYWPRAAMLLNASFYLSDNPAEGYTDQEEVFGTVARFPTDAANKDTETASWIREFPRMRRLIEDDPAFPILWGRFCDAVDAERLRPFEDAAQRAVTCITSGLGAHAEAISDFVVVPNPLQAPQIADFVRKDGILFAVIASPRPLSIAHELLHSIFEKALAQERDTIVGYRRLFAPNMVEAMVKMQYAWDSGDESWLRVFEESLVRAATIWMKGRNTPGEPNRLATLEAGVGFAYVPALVRSFEEKWNGPKDMRAFISSCLSTLDR